MSARNAAFFDMGTALGRETYLRARGWDGLGAALRTGGLKHPEPVVLGAGAVLFRLFHRQDRRYGEWWATAQELDAVIRHFDVGNAGLTEGRGAGRSALHGVFVIRHEWAGTTPADLAAHLRRFVVARLREPLMAYHGEGDVAPSAGHAQVQKGCAILDAAGRQRDVRQVFLPRPWTYQAAFQDLGEHATDSHLVGAVAKWRRGPFYFEA